MYLLFFILKQFSVFFKSILEFCFLDKYFCPYLQICKKLVKICEIIAMLLGNVGKYIIILYKLCRKFMVRNKRN